MRKCFSLLIVALISMFFISFNAKIYAGEKAKMDVIMSRGERNPYLEQTE